jgi:hypothetical protein
MQITYHNDSGFSAQISAFLFSSLTPDTFKSAICNPLLRLVLKIRRASTFTGNHAGTVRVCWSATRAE